jgi:fucose permease
MIIPATKEASATAPLALYFGFVLCGAVTTMSGPLVPSLSNRWQLNDAQTGYLFTVQFVGALTATLASGRLVEWLGAQRALVCGFSLIASGVAGLAYATSRAGIVAVLCYGVGLGIATPITNLAVSDAYPHRRAAALNLLNFVWGIGALLSPLIIGLTARRGWEQAVILFIALLAAMIVVNLLRPARLDFTQPKIEADDKAPAAWRNPLLPLTGALLFLYGGTEVSIAGWVTAHTLRLSESLNSSRSSGMMAASVFWATLLAGRAVAPLVLHRLAEDKTVLLGLGVAAIGVALLLWAGTIAGAFVGTGLAGLGLAALFPTTVAMFPKYFGAATARVASLIFALGGLGGAALPWVVGVVSERLGNLRSALLIPLLAIGLMSALQLSIMRLSTRP